jgi:hypothetical protein
MSNAWVPGSRCVSPPVLTCMHSGTSAPARHRHAGARCKGAGSAGEVFIGVALRPPAALLAVPGDPGGAVPVVRYSSGPDPAVMRSWALDDFLSEPVTLSPALPHYRLPPPKSHRARAGRSIIVRRLPSTQHPAMMNAAAAATISCPHQGAAAGMTRTSTPRNTGRLPGRRRPDYGRAAGWAAEAATFGGWSARTSSCSGCSR